MEFYTRYNPPPSPSEVNNLPSLTEQYHREEVSINSIIARYNRTGVLGTPTQVRSMFFGEFEGTPDRLEYEMTVADAKQRFMTLPSDVRAAFQNDPYQMLRELDDSSKLQKFIDLGIVRAPEPVVGTVNNPGDVSHVVKTESES